MKHLKIGLVGLGVVMLLVLGAIFLAGGEEAVAQEKSDGGVWLSESFVMGVLDRFLPGKPEPVAEDEDEASFGAISSPDLGEYYVVGGNVFRGARDDSLTLSSTTLAAFESPVATSTLVSVGLQLDVASDTAIIVEFSKSKAQPSNLFGGSSGNPNASTTKIGDSVRINANEGGYVYWDVASSSAQFVFDAAFSGLSTTTADDLNDWLLIRAYAINASQIGEGNISPSGSAKVLWQER